MTSILSKIVRLHDKLIHRANVSISRVIFDIFNQCIAHTFKSTEKCEKLQVQKVYNQVYTKWLVIMIDQKAVVMTDIAVHDTTFYTLLRARRDPSTLLGKRERQTERETDRERDRQRETEKERDREREK